MIVNFRTCEISRDTRKLTRVFTLIIIKKSNLVQFLNSFVVIQQNDF